METLAHCRQSLTTGKKKRGWLQQKERDADRPSLVQNDGELVVSLFGYRCWRGDVHIRVLSAWIGGSTWQGFAGALNQLVLFVRLVTTRGTSHQNEVGSETSDWSLSQALSSASHVSGGQRALADEAAPWHVGPGKGDKQTHTHAQESSTSVHPG